MKIKSIFRVVTVILMIAATFLPIRTVDVGAAENINTSMFVTPMMQKILLTPGEKYEGVITVSNGTTATGDLNYSVTVGSYGLNRGENDKDIYGGAVDVETKTQYNMLMDWIVLDKNNGVVHPRSQDKIMFTINVPKDAPAGAQYATILVANSTKDKQDGNNNNDNNGVAINETWQLASTIIANVTGGDVRKGSISENSIPSFLLSGPLEATSLVRNEGNVYTDAEYVLQVWPLFSDEEICTNEEKPETSLVLPDTERYHAQTCNLPSVGIFKAKQTVKIFGEESVVEKTIIICPLWLLFIIVFAIVAVIIWLVLRAKARKGSHAA